MTNDTKTQPAPSVEVGQIYRLIDEDPFSPPQGARVLDVKGKYVKYVLSINGTELQEELYSSGTITSFLARYERVSP